MDKADILKKIEELGGKDLKKEIELLLLYSEAPGKRHVQLDRWVNVYKGSGDNDFFLGRPMKYEDTRPLDIMDMCASTRRIACVPVIIEFEVDDDPTTKRPRE